MSTAYFDSTDPEMATIVYRGYGDHPNFLWFSTMGLICSFEDLILDICQLLQNRSGRIYWTSFTLPCFLTTLEPKRFVLCCIGVFGDLNIVALQTGYLSLYYLLEK